MDGTQIAIVITAIGAASGVVIASLIQWKQPALNTRIAVLEAVVVDLRKLLGNANTEIGELRKLLMAGNGHETAEAIQEAHKESS